MIKISTHQTFTCSKSTIETLEKTAFNVNIFHTFSSASIVEFEQVTFCCWEIGTWKKVPIQISFLLTESIVSKIL